jgi:outer membrane receptor protein involved in Fe transport
LNEEADWRSAFFTGTWNVTDSFRVNIGARYQEVDKEGLYFLGPTFLLAGQTSFLPRSFLPNPALVANVKSDDTLPEVGFQWDTTENMMIYAKYAEAFKAGGFVMNPPILGTPPTPFSFLPEYASGYEVGMKGTFADNRLQLNIAWFDTDFENLQVNSFNAVAGRFQVRNAAESNTQGIELDGRWAVSDNWSLGFNGGYNDAEYTYFPNGACSPIQVRDWVAAGNPAATCVADLSGARPFFGVEWQFGLNPEFSFQAGEFMGRAGLNMSWIAGTDPFFVPPPGYPPDPLATIPNRHRFDLRVSFLSPSETWEIGLYGRDITDEAAHVGGLQSGFFNSTNGTTNSEVHLYGVGGKRFERGARWGLQANYFFGR